MKDVLVVDSSALARNMYQLLFSAQSRFRVLFADEFQTLFKRSRRFRPDLLIVNSNRIEKNGLASSIPLGERRVAGGDGLAFPCPAIVVVSKGRMDLKESLAGRKDVVVIEKPFYPYDLLSVANRLLLKRTQKQRGPKGPRGRKVKGRG